MDKSKIKTELRALTDEKKLKNLDFKKIENGEFEVYEDGSIFRSEILSENGYVLKRRKLTFSQDVDPRVRLLNSKGESRTFMVKKLVFEAFYRPLIEHERIRHKDGNRRNNHFSNLYISSPLKRVSTCRISKEQANEIRELVKAATPYHKIANKYGITISYVSRIKNGNRR